MLVIKSTSLASLTSLSSFTQAVFDQYFGQDYISNRAWYDRFNLEEGRRHFPVIGLCKCSAGWDRIATIGLTREIDNIGNIKKPFAQKWLRWGL